MISFVVIFFFKQKTAYEMRISDWSSDVCSSDLLQPFGYFQPGHLVELNVHQDQIRPVRACHLERFHSVPRLQDGVTLRFQQVMEELHEIGRASCRERVCQYV